MTLIVRMGQFWPGQTPTNWITNYIDTVYAPLFGGPIMGNRIYVKPINANTPPGPFTAGSFWEQMACNDHFTGWLDARAGRVVQFGFTLAPNNGSSFNGSYPGSSGPFDLAGISQWHTDMANGVYDNLLIEFCNMLVRNNMAKSHINHWWEPAYWNWWGAQFDSRWWSNAKRQFQIMRDHGLTGRIGPDGDAAIHGYVPDTSPYADTLYYDPYTHGLGASQIPNYMDGFDQQCARLGFNGEYGEMGANIGDSDSLIADFFNTIAARWRANPAVYGQGSTCVYTETGGPADTTINFRSGYPQACAAIAAGYSTYNNDLINPGQGGPGGGTGGGPVSTAVVPLTGQSSIAKVVGPDVTFAGVAGASILNMAVYRDVLYGTKLFDITPGPGGVFTKTQFGETDGPHNYVLGTFDRAFGWVGPPAALLLSQYNMSVVVDTTVPGPVTDRSTVSTSNVGGGSVMTVAWPTGAAKPQAGDTALLWVGMASGGTTPPVDPTGFSFVRRDDNGTQVSVLLYTRRCDGLESGSVTISNAGSAGQFGLTYGLLQVKDGIAATPVDASAAATTLAGSVVTAPGVTTTKTGDLLITVYFVVQYATPAGTRTWTPPGGMTEVGGSDLYQFYNTNQQYGIAIDEQVLTTPTATGTKAATWSGTPSFAVAMTVAFAAEANTPSVQTISGISSLTDLGHVTVNAATVTSGIDTVEVYDGTIALANLVGTGTPVTGSVGVALSYPQAVGLHHYQIIGKKAGATVTAPYLLDVTVPDAPLVTSVIAATTTALVTVNGVTVEIRIYETLANGGALVTSHVPDVSGAWTFSSLGSNHQYDATAYDGTHESPRVAFQTTTTATGTTIKSVAVTNSLISVDWVGYSLRLYDASLSVIDQIVVPSGLGTIYHNVLIPGHYTVRAFDNVDPTMAVVFDEAQFDVAVTPPPPPGNRRLVVTGGTVVIYGGTVVTDQ